VASRTALSTFHSPKCTIIARMNPSGLIHDIPRSLLWFPEPRNPVCFRLDFVFWCLRLGYRCFGVWCLGVLYWMEVHLWPWSYNGSCCSCGVDEKKEWHFLCYAWQPVCTNHDKRVFAIQVYCTTTRQVGGREDVPSIS
jgi:hypothetical protein